MPAVNPSLEACQAGLKPFKKLADQGSKPGTTREYFLFKGGTYRRQIGEGHSRAERQARREGRHDRERLQRATRADFAAWLSTLTAEERAFARAHKLHRPMPEGGFSRGSLSADALDGAAERELIPEGDVLGFRNGRPIVGYQHPAELLEGAASEPAPIEGLSDEQIAGAAEDFESALRWALTLPAGCRADHQLVALGKRSAVLIAAFRADLVCGMEVVPELAREFFTLFAEKTLSETLERLRPTGALYGRYLEWMRKGRDLAGLGEHLRLVAYQLRPDLIDAATLACLGADLNKTRQAGNKKANALRDTFEGLKALCQRADITRLRCRLAQLRGGLQPQPA